LTPNYGGKSKENFFGEYGTADRREPGEHFISRGALNGNNKLSIGSESFSLLALNHYFW